jgi:hypothetical protein
LPRGLVGTTPSRLLPPNESQLPSPLALTIPKPHTRSPAVFGDEIDPGFFQGADYRQQRILRHSNTSSASARLIVGIDKSAATRRNFLVIPAQPDGDGITLWIPVSAR